MPINFKLDAPTNNQHLPTFHSLSNKMLGHSKKQFVHHLWYSHKLTNSGVQNTYHLTDSCHNTSDKQHDYHNLIDTHCTSIKTNASKLKHETQQASAPCSLEATQTEHHSGRTQIHHTPHIFLSQDDGIWKVTPSCSFTGSNAHIATAFVAPLMKHGLLLILHGIQSTRAYCTDKSSKAPICSCLKAVSKKGAIHVYM